MGDRPEAPDETATYTSKVQQQIKQGQGRPSGLHPAEQDRQGRERDRHPGRDGSRHRLRRRRTLEPAHPEERREAHPGVLRPDQQGEMIIGPLTTRRSPAARLLDVEDQASALED